MNMEWNSGWTITPPLLSFCRDFCLLFINLYLSTCICHRSKSCIFYRMVEKVWVVIFSPNTLNIYIQLCLVLFKIIFIFFLLLMCMQCIVNTFSLSITLFPSQSFWPTYSSQSDSPTSNPFSFSLSCIRVCMYVCIIVFMCVHMCTLQVLCRWSLLLCIHNCCCHVKSRRQHFRMVLHTLWLFLKTESFFLKWILQRTKTDGGRINQEGIFI